jgi:hypothetical protein
MDSGGRKSAASRHRYRDQLRQVHLAMEVALADERLDMPMSPGTVLRPPFARFGALPQSSAICPVAIRMTLTAAPITSAGRFSPRGPFGILTS